MSTQIAALDVLKCSNCSAAHLEAPSGRCPSCGASVLTTAVLAETGTVVSTTTVRLAPPGVEVPYVLAYADFAPGARLIARSEAPLRIGDAVRLRGMADQVERFRFVPEEGDQ